MAKTHFSSQKCQSCEGELHRLRPSEIKILLKEVSGWKVVKGIQIVKTFLFKNFDETSAFVKGIMKIADREDHHPEVAFGYKKCEVTYLTHSVKGLSENDFICAAKIDALLK